MKLIKDYWLGVLAIIVTAVVFLVPFAFIVLMAFKDQQQSALLDFSWPQVNNLWANIVEVASTRNWMLITAFVNSTILTVSGVTLLVIFSAMVGFVLSRRRSRFNRLVEFLILAGLMIPPAVVPTIWVLQGLGLFGKLHGLILIEVAYHLSFCVLLYKAFIATIPRELDEAAIIDGARPLDVFFRVILPLLWPVTVTIIVVQTVTIFNDFTNPLYYLPGNQFATVQLTLYNFQSQFETSYNLLFTNILLITIPPLVVFLFFNRQIIAGMTAGAVKG
ncbi:ABC transporter [Devosia sp. Root413D1]|jgi:raffinose/stachyose/melibiose transport system permease protein|uniref:carbohydrate ABC transporter permease n=1 Tax=unclassified Devosia TaxID=196773 RepID=UPI0006F4B187|nr:MULTISPECIES: carbohydrate ABC transporter permease [unclassified Devosia]KQV09153.1 ABC transporter [Devosia sp. Root105]KQW86012.1 ABC transporter [Devosia sp. Root413D1]